MKLVIGLGNPGIEYDKTRHNIGYMFLDYITNNAEFSLNKRFKALQYEATINNEKIIFVKPLTFMNSSGLSVVKYLNYYKLTTNDILVIQDDLDMEIGKYKLLFNHGDGGHNGIKSIINCLQSREFLRLKIGISKATIDPKDYVLGKFGRYDLKKIDESFSKLKDLVLDYVMLSKDLLMGKYNVKDKINPSKEG